ncbi:MAG: hypothetical protein WC264_01320 [Candidatus Paceibacterota bacterium]|jgi:hypothetical protein
MKNLIIFALLFGIELSSFGQVQAIFPKYNSPSKEELKELAFQETAKGFAFRNSLIENINAGLKDTIFKVSNTRINEIFNHLYLEEVYLEEGGYMNSGWDPKTKKIVQSIGHKNPTGSEFAWVFRIGTFSIIIIRSKCGNILAVPVTRVEKIKIPKQETNANVNNDNVGKVYVNENNSINNQNYQQENIVYGKQVTVRTGAVFIPDPPIYYRNNYQRYGGYSIQKVVTAPFGASSYSNHYGGNCSHNHGNGYSNNHSSGNGNNSYYGHRN